jgi:hypothetical protein
LHSYPSPFSQSLIKSLPVPEDSRDDFDGLTPADLSDEQIDQYRRGQRWREAHLLERTTHADKTFAEFVSRNEYTPRSSQNRCTCNAKKQCSLHPLASTPIEDLVFPLNCVDGPLALNRDEVLILMSAKRLGKFPIVNTTRQMVRDLIDGWR